MNGDTSNFGFKAFSSERNQYLLSFWTISFKQKDGSYKNIVFQERLVADSPFSGPRKEDNRRAQTPMDLSRFPSYFCSLSPHPSPDRSQPVHGERRLYLLRRLTSHAPSPLTLPPEDLPDTANTANKGNPATQTCPNTHASFLGRDGPWSRGSPRQPSQAPNL